MWMRVHDRTVAGAVQEALHRIPYEIQQRVTYDLVIGVDGRFAGVHEYEDYEDTACVMYEWHQ